MGVRRQQAIVNSGLDDRIPSLATRHLLTHIARISDDRWEADHSLCCRLALLVAITKVNKRTIKTSLHELDQQNIIRLSRYERRYNPKYDIVIIDPAYIDALELLKRERASEQAQPDPLPLVKEREIHSHGKEREIHSPNGKEREALSPNGKEREIHSHSRPKGLDLKGSTSYKEPTAGDPTPTTAFVYSGQVNSDRNSQEITPDPPAPQTNDEIRHEHTQLIDILNRPPVTPEDHKHQEEAQERLYELTRGKKRAPSPDPTPPAAEVAAEPLPLDSERQSQKERQNARLTELLETKAQSRQESNQEIRDINAKIDEIKAEQLPAAEEADRIDALIAARIATLDTEPQPDPEATAPTPASSAGNAALELATGPPTADSEREAAEVDAQPEPVDSFRQAQEADREYRQAKIVHNNRSRKRRKPERNAVHPWTHAQVPQPQQNGQHASIRP